MLAAHFSSGLEEALESPLSLGILFPSTKPRTGAMVQAWGSATTVYVILDTSPQSPSPSPIKLWVGQILMFKNDFGFKMLWLYTLLI